MRVRDLALVLAAAAAGVAYAKSAVDAAWGPGKVAIDGNADEWQGSMTFLDGPQLFVGVRNDASDLYLCVFSRDPEVGLRAVARGLVLELRAKGNEPLRIQFPIGAFESALVPTGGSAPTFLVSGPGSTERRRIPVENPFGIELRLGSDPASFTYEAKIPLAVSAAHPYAVGGRPGAELALGLEPPRLERDAARREGAGPSVPRAGGIAGPRGGDERGEDDRTRSERLGGRPDRGLRSEEERPMLPQPLEVKVKLRLAPPPEGTP